MNRTSLIISITSLGALASTPSFSKPVKEQKPNIVFILADDYGWKDMGCSGSKYYETPNLDRLAAEGIRFTHAYSACSVCSPSRASILTGQYTPRHDITNFIGAPSEVNSGGNRTVFQNYCHLSMLITCRQVQLPWQRYFTRMAIKHSLPGSGTSEIRVPILRIMVLTSMSAAMKPVVRQKVIFHPIKIQN